MKFLTNYIVNKMVVTSASNNYDGGDSCAYGFVLYYVGAVSEFESSIETAVGQSGEEYAQALEITPGRYCRNPDTTMWYSRTDTFSRDQMIPLMVYLGYTKSWKRMLRLFGQHALHLFLFAWNTRNNAALPGTPEYKWKVPDVTFFDTASLWIRGFRAWLLYPLLTLLDLQSLGSVLLYKSGLVKTTLQMNQALMVDYAMRVMPTPISWLTRKIYGRSMPALALNETFEPDWQPPVDNYLNILIWKWK